MKKKFNLCFLFQTFFNNKFFSSDISSNNNNKKLNFFDILKHGYYQIFENPIKNSSIIKKNFNQVAVIYMFFNSQNGKSYVGSSPLSGLDIYIFSKKRIWIFNQF